MAHPLQHLRRWMVSVGTAGLLLSASASVLAHPHADGAELALTAEPSPGESFEVFWSGPGASGDFIALSIVGAAPGTYIDYARLRGNAPVTLTAPAEQGTYEVRYISVADGLKVLAHAPFVVSAASEAASEPSIGISSPPEAEPSGEIEIGVTDAGDAFDFITIVEPGAPATTIGPYVRLNGKRQVRLRVPGSPGLYEIRQVAATDMRVVASASLTVVEQVVPPVPTVKQQIEREQSHITDLIALPAVDRSRRFQVYWSGEAAPGDIIAIVSKGSSEAVLVMDEAMANRPPAEITAPSTPGSYELIFLHGRDGQVQARRTLEVR